jgi:hypothetical protein
MYNYEQCTFSSESVLAGDAAAQEQGWLKQLKLVEMQAKILVGRAVFALQRPDATCALSMPCLSQLHRWLSL